MKWFLHEHEAKDEEYLSPLYFIVTYSSKDDHGDQLVEIRTDEDMYHVTFGGLTPDTEYAIYVISVGKYGNSTRTMSIRTSIYGKVVLLLLIAPRSGCGLSVQLIY